MEYAASQSNMDRMAQEMQQGNQEGAPMPEAGGSMPAVPNSSGGVDFPKVDSKVLNLPLLQCYLRK